MRLGRIARRSAWGAVLVFSAATASCGGPTAPSSVDVRFAVTGETRVPTFDSGDANYVSDAASAAAGTGAIVVLGRMVLPTRCFVMTPSVMRLGATLDIVIDARASGAAPCTSWMVARSYSLRVGSLARGTYHVRVVHQVAGVVGVGASTPVLVRDVSVE